MQTVTTIGLDIAKSVFQVHGIDAEGNVLIRRQLGLHGDRLPVEP
jgi:transposase